MKITPPVLIAALLAFVCTVAGGAYYVSARAEQTAHNTETRRLLRDWIEQAQVRVHAQHWYHSKLSDQQLASIQPRDAGLRSIKQRIAELTERSSVAAQEVRRQEQLESLRQWAKAFTRLLELHNATGQPIAAHVAALHSTSDPYAVFGFHDHIALTRGDLRSDMESLYLQMLKEPAPEPRLTAEDEAELAAIAVDLGR